MSNTERAPDGKNTRVKHADNIARIRLTQYFSLIRHNLLGLRNRLCDEIELLDGASAEFDMGAVRSGDLTPVFFGSALTNFGVEVFLAFAGANGPVDGTGSDTQLLLYFIEQFKGVVVGADKFWCGSLFAALSGYDDHAPCAQGGYRHGEPRGK